MNRFFVTVYAKQADDLRRLQKHEFDVFANTAKRVDVETRPTAGFGFSIEGLLSTAQIETLVGEGYRVMVEDTIEARSNPSGQTVEFSEWLERMKPPLAKDRAVRR